MRRGRPASPGRVAGPIHRLATTTPAERRGGDAASEAAALGAAIARAAAELEALAATLSGPAAEVVEFQRALAEDDALAAPALAAIQTGTEATAAWTAAIAAVADDYRSTGDDYIRARAADLEDLGARVAALLAGEDRAAASEPSLPERAIVVARDIAPSRFLALDWSGRGIALAEGSPASHVAMLARARGVAMVTGLGPVELPDGAPALLDGDAGTLLLGAAAAIPRSDPGGGTVTAARGAGPLARTADGTAIALMVNVADLGDLDRLDPAATDGIGLTRTEFLFRDAGARTGEEAQLAAYARLLAWAGGRPVVVRTVDAGGDKAVAGEDGAAGGFLGLVGVRRSLAAPERFSVQLRALLRAAALGDLRILVPMVTVPEEMARVRALVAEAARDLDRRGAAHRVPMIGMMVEVPAAALTLDLFAADFASIGSNDLTQYVMAAARDAPEVAALADPGGAAMLRLIAATVGLARARSLPLSLCGDAAAEPGLVPALLGAGLRTLSVPPRALAAVARAVAGVDLGAAPAAAGPSGGREDGAGGREGAGG